MKKIIIGGISGVIAILGYLLFFTNTFDSDYWAIFYYPNGCLHCENYQNDFPRSFDTLEECRNWGHNLKEYNDNPNDTFECGLNCKKHKDFDGYVCKETIDN